MPTYEYRCVNDYHPPTVYQWSFADFDAFRHNVECPICGKPATQVISPPSFHRGIDGHFNTSLGSYVSGRREYEDGLKRASESATLKTGITHDFRPVDLRDKDRLGVTDEGLDSTRRVEVSEGKREVKKWY